MNRKRKTVFKYIAMIFMDLFLICLVIHSIRIADSHEDWVVASCMVVFAIVGILTSTEMLD